MKAKSHKVSIDTLRAQIWFVCVRLPGDSAHEQVFAEMKKALPELEVFPAVVGENLTKAEFKTYIDNGFLDKQSVFFRRTGEVGCYLSHLQLLDEFVQSDKQYCLVLEEDAVIKPDFLNSALSALTECLPDLDLLYFYNKSNDREGSLSVLPHKENTLRLKQGVKSTLSYLVSKQGARKLIRQSRPMRAYVIDRHYSHAVSHHKNNSFITKKNLVHPMGHTSTINSTVYFRLVFWWQFVLIVFYFPLFYLLFLPRHLLQLRHTQRDFSRHFYASRYLFRGQHSRPFLLAKRLLKRIGILTQIQRIVR